MTGIPGCKDCGGKGWFRTGDDLYSRPCRCVRNRKIAQHLGPAIADAPIVSSTPLYVIKDGKVETDHTKSNLFITSTWNAAAPHFKRALANKGLSFYTKVTTDEEVKRVFVGATSFKSLTAEQREIVEVNNSLDELAGSNYDLAIIQLGVISHPNKAAANCHLELLKIREVLNKATWILMPPDRAFSDLLVWSSDLDMYIDKHFAKISFDVTAYPADPKPIRSLEEATAIADSDEPPQDENAMVPEDTYDEPVAVASQGDTMDLPGEGSSSQGKRKPYPKKKRPNSGGGGPL
jgi:hypothetical protein